MIVSISRLARVRGAVLLLLAGAGLSGCGESFSITFVPTFDEECFQEEVIEEQCFEQEIIVEVCDEVFSVLFCTEELVIELICQDVVVGSIIVCE